jgi:heme oxygenase
MDPGPSHTLLRLELETHAYHRDADRAWLRLLAHDVTRATYTDQLARAYRFEAPLEAALACTSHVPSLFGTRCRSCRLADDLAALDIPVARLAPRVIAPFPSLSEALGWLYVVERSARLYDMVERNIRTRLPGAPTSYVDDLSALTRWNMLGETIDRIARTPRIRDQILHAAHDAFRTALDWFKPEPVRRGA